MKKAFPLPKTVLSTTIASLLAGTSALAATTYQWDGGAGTGNWQTAQNWSPDAVAAFNTTGVNRLNVNGAITLVHSAAEGTTTYANTDAASRGLVIGSGSLGAGSMSITGGTFSTAGSTAPDVIGNATTPATSTLNIAGGSFIGNSSGLVLNFANPDQTTFLNLTGGSAILASLTLSSTTTGSATVNLDGGSLTTTRINRTSTGTGTFNFNGGTLVAGASSTTFLQGLSTASVKSGGAIIDTNVFTITVGQNLLDGAGGGGLTKLGTGTLTLSGANTYTGVTSVSAGALNIQNASALGGTGAGTTVADLAALELQGGITVTGETLTLNGGGTFGALRSISGNNTWTGNITAVPVGGITRIGSDAGLLTLSGNITVSGGVFDQFVVQGAGNLTVSGIISGAAGLTSSSNGSGIRTLSGANTYTGPTRLNGGTLSVASLNSIVGRSVSSHLGAPLTAANGTISIGSTTVPATLRYTGSGETTDRIISLAGSTGGATLDQSGTGTLRFTSPTEAAADIKTLTLQGSSAGTGEFSGAITNGSGEVSVLKAGTGTWTLSGANTYTGATTVSAGTLRVGNGGLGQTGTGAVIVSGGGTLLGTGSVRGSSFSLESGATLLPGASSTQADYATLTFQPVSGSGALEFQTGSAVFLGINPGGPSDQLTFLGTGTNTLLFNSNLTIGPAFLTPGAAEVFNLLDWTGLSAAPLFASHFAYTGLLTGNGDEAMGLDLPDLSGSGFFWDISGMTTSGQLALVMPLPEPSRALLLCAGSLGLLLRRRRAARK